MEYFWGVSPGYLPKPTYECIKTITLTFKLCYVSTYRLYTVCQRCGCEFDYYYFQGICPYCGNNLILNYIDDPPQPGFVFFPELLLETSPLALFPELAFYPQ